MEDPSGSPLVMRMYVSRRMPEGVVLSPCKLPEEDEQRLATAHAMADDAVRIEQFAWLDREMKTKMASKRSATPVDETAAVPTRRKQVSSQLKCPSRTDHMMAHPRRLVWIAKMERHRATDTEAVQFWTQELQRRRELAQRVASIRTLSRRDAHDALCRFWVHCPPRESHH